MSDEAVARLSRTVKDKEFVAAPRADMFKPAKVPDGVLPDGGGIAMDDALSLSGQWAGTTYGGPFVNLAPIPMTVLAMMSQRAEYWKIADVPAKEATRRWIKITSVDQDGDKTDRIQAIEEALAYFKVRDAFRDAIRRDGLMGRGHVFIDTGEDDRSSPIGNGKSAGSRQKIKKGGLKAVRSIDPLWVYPQAYNSRDPLAPDFYRPTSWFVMGKEIHATRLLTLTARDVPDILKPAYSFGGLSLTQIAEPYVMNWLRTRQSVAEIVSAFSVFVLKTNLLTGLQGGASSTGAYSAPALPSDGAGLDARLMLFNLLRDNRGVMAIDKDAEDFANVSAQLGTLDKLQAQAQEQMASVASIPLVKLLGITPSGLNASSDGEVRVFYDDVHAGQEDHLREPLQVIIDMVQLHLFGDVDESIRFNFEPLWTMSEKDRAEVDKLEAETDQIHVDSGVLAPLEVRQQLANDPDSRYPGLDVDDVPDLLDEEEAGLEPAGGRPDPVAGNKSGAME